MAYIIREVDGAEYADELHRFNGMCPETFPTLTARHIENGFWWFAYLDAEAIAFAGMVEMIPFPSVGYLKRAYVMPDHRGHGLQSRFMALREAKAREIGWTHIVSECAETNVASAANFSRSGFSRCDPEQKWGAPNSAYWIKSLL